MKKLVFLLLTISLLFLCACGESEKEENKFNQWKESFLAQDTKLTANVHSYNKESNESFQIIYEKNLDGEKIEILAPKELKGVYCTKKDGQQKISFGDVLLEIPLDDEELSPVNALSLYGEMVKDGFLKRTWTEKLEGKELLAFELERGDGLLMNAYFDKDMKIEFACFIQNEKVKIKIEF